MRFRSSKFAAMSAGAGLALAAGLASTSALALPGDGVEVVPMYGNVDGEIFQHRILMEGLEQLGYDVQDLQGAKYPVVHLAIAQGDATFFASHWDPLHTAFYQKAGGDDVLAKPGEYIPGCTQGYLIDKKTAEAKNITSIDQIDDPEIAKLFDADGDGKADLHGCPPGWGCERVIEHHMDAYELKDNVEHKQGEYSAVIAQAITRYQQGEPILYYTWTPYWVSGVLVPGKDVTWIEVPFTSLPEERTETEKDTMGPDGRNLGFVTNTQRVVANREFLEENPAAKKFFEVAQLDADAISDQNLKMRNGEDSPEDIERHVQEWLDANKEKFQGWIDEAMKAGEG